MTRRGFTIVELLITITIMGILLTLAVVNLNSTQANARDAERKGDAESLAFHLESYYTNKNPDVYGSGGSYPGYSFITNSNIKATLPDLDPKNARAPGVADTSPISVVRATSADTSTGGVQPQPSAANDVYVYQPLTVTNALCADPGVSECRRFNIFYFQETDNSVHVVTSRHQ